MRIKREAILSPAFQPPPSVLHGAETCGSGSTQSKNGLGRHPMQVKASPSKVSNLLLVAVGIYLSGCGLLVKEKTKTVVLDPKNPEYLRLANVENAPQAVRTASRAVVNIGSAMSSGTGSFVSKDGLLMTNDHVLGTKICAQSGCYVTLQKNYEAGAGRSYSSLQVFAVPKAVSESLDVAFLQIYSIDPTTQTPGPKLSTEDFLEFTTETPDSLKGKMIHIVGHPATGLKKWSFGEVFESNGDWFQSEALILPGSSGSPILNSEGKIVGILHRGYNSSASDITQQGIRNYSIGTASTPLIELMKSLEGTDLTPSSLLTDVSKITTKEEFLKDAEIYLNSRAKEVSLESPSPNPASPSQIKTHPAVIIAEALDNKILLPTNTMSQNVELRNLAVLASNWIDCQSQVIAGSFKFCPTGEDKEKWINRIEAIMAKTKEMNGLPPLYLIADYSYILSSNLASAEEAALRSVLKHSGSKLNFSIASLLIAYSDRKTLPKFGDSDLKNYVMNFESAQKYEHYYPEIIQSIGFLFRYEFISQSEFASKIKYIMNDPKTTLRERIRAEKVSFSAGLL